MKISYHTTTYNTVDLPDKAIKEVTENHLRSMLYPGQFLRKDSNGKLVVKKDEDGWRHGSVSEEYVRDATELDIAIFKVLENL